MATKRALVIGGAACIWTDAEAALDLCEFDAVIAVNDVGAAWPGPLAAWVSYHQDNFPRWIEQREANGFPKAETWGHDTWLKKYPTRPVYADRTVVSTFPDQRDSGSSGLFAVKVALIDFGFEQVVCAGVPMDPQNAHFFNNHAWRGAIHLRRGWDQAMPHIRGRVRSVSGWTRKLLGAPTPEWLGQS